MTKYIIKHDRLSRYITLAALLLVAAVLTYFFYLSSGTYLPAWLTIIAVLISILCILSTPRYVTVSSRNVEINCLLELTILPLKKIKSVEIVEHKQRPCLIPLWGLWGVLGYFGFYLDLRTFRLYRLFAAQRKNYVKITLRGRKIPVIVTVAEPKKFVDDINSKIE